MPPNGIPNFQSLSGMGVYSIVQILRRNSNIPVWKGVVTIALNWSTINK